jgi:tryptophanyl-tRNA synthetase
MRAVTDSGCDYDPATASPGVVNLMGILSAITGEPVPAIAARFAGQGYGYLKAEVADAVVAELEPIQAAYARYMDDPAELDRVLGASTDAVRAIAAATMHRVRRATGIG